jgi:hypothetical protein
MKKCIMRSFIICALYHKIKDDEYIRERKNAYRILVIILEGKTLET